MISLTNYDFQWARSELVIIYPYIYIIYTQPLQLWLSRKTRTAPPSTIQCHRMGHVPLTYWYSNSSYTVFPGNKYTQKMWIYTKHVLYSGASMQLRLSEYINCIYVYIRSSGLFTIELSPTCIAAMNTPPEPGVSYKRSLWGNKIKKALSESMAVQNHVVKEHHCSMHIYIYLGKL